MKQNDIFNRYSLAGLGATLIGNGIGRFAYIALMPVLIQAGWFSESEASYLGAATLIGYIFGVPVISLLIRYYSPGQMIRVAMLICSFSYLGCAIENAPIEWFYLLRTLAGTSGAMLVILAPPLIVRMHSPVIKNKISGVIFSGIGLGVLLSGTLVPLLIFHSVLSAWLGIGAIALAATCLTWNAWRTEPVNGSAGVVAGSFHNLSNPQRTTLALILVAYSLDAIGYLPHTMFWVDFIVRKLEMPFVAGGLLWASFGVGAILGPVLAGFMGDRFGVRRALIASFLFKGVGVALPMVTHHPIALVVSSLLVGIFTPGTVSLVSIYILESVGYELHTKSWGAATLAFAVSQGVVGYGMAHYAPVLDSYYYLFAVSAGALLIAASLIALSPKSKLKSTYKNALLQAKE